MVGIFWVTLDLRDDLEGETSATNLELSYIFSKHISMVFWRMLTMQAPVCTNLTRLSISSLWWALGSTPCWLI